MRSRIRIALLVCFGVLAIALCVLWVGSYRHLSVVSLQTSPSHRYELVSAEGMLIILRQQRIIFNIEFTRADPYFFIPDLTAGSTLGIGRFDDGGSWAVGVAYGWLASTALAAALVPWMRWGFSLRTLFFATTLVAAVLGMVVYAVR